MRRTIFPTKSSHLPDGLRDWFGAPEKSANDFEFERGTGVGDLIRFPSEYGFDIDSFIEMWTHMVAKFGEPLRLYVPNEKRIEEFNKAVNLLQNIVDSDSDLDFEFGIDNMFKSKGYAEIRGCYVVIMRHQSELYSGLEEVIELADGVEIGCTDDERCFIAFTFNDVMTLKT